MDDEWDYVKIYDLGDGTILVAIENHSRYIDDRSYYSADIVKADDFEEIKAVLVDHLDDQDLIEQVVSRLSSSDRA